MSTTAQPTDSGASSAATVGMGAGALALLAPFLPYIVIGLVILFVLYVVWAAVSSLFGNPENVEARQEGRTERTTIRQDSKSERTEARQDGKSERTEARQEGHTERVEARKETKDNRNMRKTCKKVCCDKRFLGLCTSTNAKCYNECTASA